MILPLNYEKLKSRMARHVPRVHAIDLATIAGVAPSTMSGWLRRGEPMQGAAVIKIADFFKLDAETAAAELLGIPKKQAATPTVDEALEVLKHAIIKEVKK